LEFKVGRSRKKLTFEMRRWVISQ
jgi:hypothetical protein